MILGSPDRLPRRGNRPVARGGTLIASSPYGLERQFERVQRDSESCAERDNPNSFPFKSVHPNSGCQAPLSGSLPCWASIGSLAWSTALARAPLRKLGFGQCQSRAVGRVTVLPDLLAHVLDQVIGPVVSETAAYPAIGVPHCPRHPDFHGWRVIGGVCAHGHDSIVWPHSYAILCGHTVFLFRNQCGPPLPGMAATALDPHRSNRMETLMMNINPDDATYGGPLSAAAAELLPGTSASELLELPAQERHEMPPRARRCPLCGAWPCEPCSPSPEGDHLARYLDAYTAGQLTKAYMARTLGELVVIDASAVIPAPRGDAR